jgi:hypothetical protein
MTRKRDGQNLRHVPGGSSMSEITIVRPERKSCKLNALACAFIAVAFGAVSSAPLQAQAFKPIAGLAFTKVFAGQNPLPQTLTIASTGANFAFTSAASTSTGGSWLSVSVGIGCTGGGSCSTPHPITVTVNPIVTLAAGSYTGQIVFTASGGAFSMTVPVTLTIAPPDTALFDNLPGEMSFFMKTGGLAPPSQNLQIRNGGSGSLAWTLAVSTSDGGNWLSASATAGSAPSFVNLTLLKQNLPNGGVSAGTFTGRLLFQTAGGGSVTVPVSVDVGDAVFSQVNGINFTKLFAGADPLPQTLTIASTGANFGFITTSSTATGGDWLSVSVGSGCTGGGFCNTPHTITATVNPVVTLAAGTYTAQIVLISNSLAMTVPVTLTVAPPAAPFFDNVAGQMSFSLKTNGLAPPSQIVEIRNGGSAGFLDWTLTAATSDGGNWLTVSTISGTAPSLVTVGISVANLPNTALIPGTFTGQLLFQAAGSRVTIPVSVSVADAVFNQVNPINFTKLVAGPDPLPQTLVIASTGANFSFSTAASTATGGDWLSVTIGGGCTGGGFCNTPHTVTAIVNASPTLPAGTYTGQVVLTSSTGAIAMTVPVTLTVALSSAAFFDNVPGQMSFSFKTGGSAPPSQTIQIRNAGAGTLNWTLTTSTSDGGGWLIASAGSGMAPSSVTISLLKQNLPGAGLIAGTFNGHLLFQTAGGGSVTVPVSVAVGSDVFQQVNPISFTKPFSGANPLPQVLTIAGAGASIAFSTAASTATGGDWLSVPVGAGCTGGGVCATPHILAVTVNASPTLAAGTYTGQIVVTSTTSAISMTVPVTLTVAPSNVPSFDNVPGQMSFSLQTAGGNPASQTVQIRNAGSGALDWTLSAATSDSGNWLSASASGGTAPSTITVGIIAGNLPGSGLVAGVFTGMLAFTSAGSSVSIPVSVVVGTPAFVQPAPLSFAKTFGGANPLAQTLNVTSNGTAISFLTSGSAATGGNWLTVAIGGGCTGGGFCATPHTITASVNPSPALAPGIYTGQIVFNGTSMAMTVPVTLTVVGQTPASITATSGTPQSATLNTAFGSPLVATVRDSGNSPVSGVTVTFTAPGSGASGAFAGGVNTAVTNAQGQATSAAFTANGTAGAYNVTATVAGIASPAAFALTNNAVVVPSCVTSITPPLDIAPPAGRKTTFTLTTAAGCAWTASSSKSWLEIFPLTGKDSGLIEWTAYPNFGTTARTATVTVGDKTFSVTQTASTETLMQRFVRLLYFSYLGRAATDAEVAGQVNSGLNRTQLATNFLNSAEFNLGGRFTAGLYVGIINRNAEFTGWQFQRQALARGAVNQDQLVSNFLNSAEFSLKFGVLTNADFVRLMYRNILLREASQTEVNAWLNVLSNPANTRTIIARSFLNAPEFQKGTGPRLLAFLLYSTLLLRDPNSVERAALEGILADSAQLQEQTALFANGTEINALLQ